jgi:UrcA family protein
MKPRMAGLVLSLMSAVAVADPQPKGAAETLQVKVAIGDLDLSCAAGIEQARARIHAAALHSCNIFRNASHIDDRETAAECVRDAEKVALERLKYR